MLQGLFELVAIGAQMTGIVVLMIGCLYVASGIFSYSIWPLGKGFALILAGGYLAGLGGIAPVHPH